MENLEFRELIQDEFSEAVVLELARVTEGLEKYSKPLFEEVEWNEFISAIGRDPEATPSIFARMIAQVASNKPAITSSLSSAVARFIPDGLPSNSKAHTGFICLLSTCISLACCKDAVTHLKNGDRSACLTSVGEANQWMGFMLGTLSGFNSNKALTESAKLKANKRHEPNHENRKKVFAWCEENMDRFSSMDAAAFDIAETFVPNKFRTVRDWLSEWRKLQSAGRA